MSWYHTFNEDLPTWATYLSGFVSPDEPSNVRLTGPYDDRAEIGVYSHQLARARAESFRRTLMASGYTSLATGGVSAPETPSLTLGEGLRESSAPPRLNDFDLPSLPPVLIPVRAAVHQLVRELLEHPCHVVRAQARWEAQTFRPRGTLEATLVLENPGVEPVELHSPAAPAAPASIILTVGSTARSNEVEQVELSAKDVVCVDARGAKQAPTEYVVLAPGEQAYFRLKKKVYLRPGSYRGTVTLRANEEDSAPFARAYGVLLAKAGGFDVKGWW
jgi:hypothetical protein